MCIAISSRGATTSCGVMLCDSNDKDEPGNVATSVDETVGVNIALIE